MPRRVITKEEADARKRLVALQRGEEKARDLNATTEPEAETQKPDDYLSKILKYIPAEIIAVFVTAEATVTSIRSEALEWTIFGALLTFTPLYVWRATHTKETVLPNDPLEVRAEKENLNKLQNKNMTLHIMISISAFFLWVLTLGGPFVFYESGNSLLCSANCWYHKEYGALVLPFFTLLIPFFPTSEKPD